MIRAFKISVLIITLGFFNQSFALSQSRLDDMMREMASNTSSKLPMRIDSRTVWISTGYIDGELHHTYELIGVIEKHLNDKSRLRSAKKALEEEKRNIYCTHPEMKIFRKYNIPVVYNYVTDTGLFILRAFSSNSHC